MNGAFTIEAWVKPETLPATGYPGFLRKGSAALTAAPRGWLVWYKRDTLVMSFKRQGVERTLPGWKLTAGAWSHVALTYDGTATNTLRFYLNGVLVGTVAGPAGGYAAVTSSDPLQIGKGDGTTSDHSVDEVALYATALSATAVQNHYRVGRGQIGPAPPPAAPTGLTASLGSGSVALQWTAGPGGGTVSGYRIYRRDAVGSWPTAPLGTSATSTFTDSAVTAGSSYGYRVTAYAADGAESGPSNEVTAVVPGGGGGGFQTVTVVSGLSKPTAVAWTPDGRVLIAQKAGAVRVASSDGTLSATPIVDLSDRVNSYGDRGLLGIAVDAAFATNHYVYLLYTVELSPGSPDGSGPMVSRLSRVVLNPDNTLVNPASPETVLLGTAASAPCGTPSNTNDCIPSDGTSHSIGTVRADTDGTLWLGSGDASSYAQADPNAFRTYDEQSFAGKIIHVDRNGLGLPGHPFCPSNADLTHVCTKIYAKGFRNPFRFTLRAGAGPVVGDVGWGAYEEIDLVRAGGNYGWPCYEGTVRTYAYSDMAACAAEYAKEGTPSAALPPFYQFPHLPIGSGGAVVGGPLYTGNAYPAAFVGSIFYADYVNGVVRRVLLDGNGNLSGSADFVASGWSGIDLQQAPDGTVAWVDPGGFAPGMGAVRRWVADISGVNQPPAAYASATPLTGSPPLPVQFTGSASTDPDGDTLSYDWDFGDSTAHASSASPSHTYAVAGTYTATLRVDDGHGHSSTATVTVVVTQNTPPTVSITSPGDASKYRDGQAIPLSASATDVEDVTLPASAYSWRVILHHGSHVHDLTTATGASASFTTLADHDADSYYEIVLTVTDSGGLTATRTVTIQPETVSLTLASSPSGAAVSFGGTGFTAPATVTTAIGYQATVSAVSSFVSGGQTYQFVSWSDGGARVHTITVPAASSTLTASYSATTATSCLPPPLSGYGSLVAGESGVVGFWRLGEASGSLACDVVGSGSGSYAGAVALGGAGALTGDLDTAARFGGGGRVDVPSQAAFSLNGAFTIEAWVKPETLPATGYPGFLRKGSAAVTSAAGGWLVWYARDTLVMRFKRQGLERSVPGWKLTAGVWSHVAVSYDGTAANRLRFYLNGALVGTASGPAGGYVALTSSDPLQIGRGDGTTSDHSVDEVALYATALSATAVQNHYQVGKG